MEGSIQGTSYQGSHLFSKKKQTNIATTIEIPTLPETNIASENGWFPIGISSSMGSIFRCELLSNWGLYKQKARLFFSPICWLLLGRKDA